MKSFHFNLHFNLFNLDSELCFYRKFIGHSTDLLLTRLVNLLIELTHTYNHVIEIISQSAFQRLKEEYYNTHTHVKSEYSLKNMRLMTDLLTLIPILHSVNFRVNYKCQNALFHFYQVFTECLLFVGLLNPKLHVVIREFCRLSTRFFHLVRFCFKTLYYPTHI